MKLPAFIWDLSLPPKEYHCALRVWSREMRDSSPIVWDEKSASWLVFRHAEVARVQSDYQTFSSEHTVIDARQPNYSPSIVEMDPPHHQQMRSLITQAFSARTIASMESQVRQIADELLDKLPARDCSDWVAELANPLPVIVIAKMLGLPAEKWQQFKYWTDAVINKSAEQEQASQQLIEHFEQAIARCRKQPGPNILSLLIASEIDGERLDHDALVAFCSTLFIAGNITTTNMLGNMLLCFDEYPEELQHLREQPELAASAVEEILRYMPPFRAGPNDLIRGRIAKTDVHLCEQLVRTGEQVQVNRVSANFDERQFSNPERFEIDRTPNRHQTFGHGIHFCLGAPLARLEVRVVLERLLNRSQWPRIMPGVSLWQVPSSLMFGVQSLPVVWDR